MRSTVVPHGVVDHQLVAAVEQVQEADRAVGSDDLDRPVELDHRQPSAGRGDRVAFTGVGLLARQQLFARGLPGGQVDDGRLAGEVAARLVGRGRHGASAVSSRAPSTLLRRRTIPVREIRTNTERPQRPATLTVVPRPPLVYDGSPLRFTVQPGLWGRGGGPWRAGSGGPGEKPTS